MPTFSASIPNHILSHETIILPISMNQPLERGERLAAIVRAIHDHDYGNRTTVLICDYLNRHNCKTKKEALAQGDAFLQENQQALNGLNIVRWKDFLINKQAIFEKQLSAVKEKSTSGSHFYLKMKKTWEKCLSTTQSLEASIQYQIEEYAAVLCMDEFDHLFYPKRVTNGLAFLYNDFAGKKPQYHHVKISEKKAALEGSVLININQIPHSKDRRHIHIAFRALLEQMDTLLASGELSIKAKRIFAEEAENVLMSHGLLSPHLEDRESYSDKLFGLN